MINLISLPVAYFNMPQIENCIIKNLLNKNNIDSHHYDITNIFLDKCIDKYYICEVYTREYNLLSINEQAIINSINTTKQQLIQKKSIPTNLDELNKNFQQVLNFIAACNQCKWSSRSILFKYNISSITELLNFSMSNDAKLFDDVFEFILQDFNESDTYFFSIKFAYQMPFAIRLASSIKRKFKKSFIVWGGDYITQIKKNLEQFLIKCKYVDAIVLYGDYNNFIQLLKNKQTYNCYINRKSNVIFYDNSNQVDSSPEIIPCFDDLHLDKYLSNMIIVPYYLNYGCFHSKCTFCNRYIFYNGFHVLNTEQIFDSIKTNYYKNGIQGIYFVDECVPENCLTDFSNYVLDNQLNIKWIVETRFQNNFLKKGLVEKYYKSGLREISFGLETTSTRLIKLMDKQISLKKFKQILKLFFKNGIFTNVTIMIHYPSESKYELLKTLSFIKNFRFIDSFGLSEFKLLRNSILCNNLKIDYSANLNILYGFKCINNTNKILNKFYQNKKICNFLKKRVNILYRTQYMFLNKQKYSLNPYIHCTNYK